MHQRVLESESNLSITFDIESGNIGNTIYEMSWCWMVEWACIACHVNGDLNQRNERMKREIAQSIFFLFLLCFVAGIVSDKKLLFSLIRTWYWN